MSDVPIYLSLGAGVQSSTLALMASRGEIGPMPKAAIFADTQDEPDDVYEWLDWLEKQLAFPVIRVSKGKLSSKALEMHQTADGRLFPKVNIPFFTLSEDGTKGKIRSRSCTAVFKIKPIIAEVRNSVGREAFRLWRRKHAQALKAIRYAKRRKSFDRVAWDKCQADPLAIQWIGISTDEVVRGKPSRDPWLVSQWPLIEKRISRHRCIDWMLANYNRVPPKSACVECPFRDNPTWRLMQIESPANFQKSVQFEQDMNAARSANGNSSSQIFLHRSCKPLDQVDFRSDIELGQMTLFGDECEGMCGV